MKTSTRAVALSALLVALGVSAVVWAVVWLQRGSYLTALVVFALPIWAFGFAAYFVHSSSGAAKPRTTCGPNATVLQTGGFSDASFVAATSAIFIAAVLYLLIAPFGMVDYVTTGVMRTAVPAACAFLVVFGAPTLYRMVTQGGGGHLRLDHSGFEVWNGQWGTFRRGTWGEIERIQDHPPRGRTPFNEVIVFVLPKGRSAVLMSDAITGNSQALREWVQFYWKHPEFRGELADDCALRRLYEENFNPE